MRFQKPVMTLPYMSPSHLITVPVLLAMLGCADTANGPSKSGNIEIVNANAIVGRSVSGSGCALRVSSATQLPTVVTVPDAYAGNIEVPDLQKMKAWARRVMEQSSNARVSDASASLLKKELMLAAQANAMQWPANWNSGEHRPSSVIYHTMETLFPAVIAYMQNRERFSPEEQQVFENWSEQLVGRIGRTDKVRSHWKLDNKRYQFGALLAAQSIISGDASGLSKSRQIYQTAIRGMRSDGSLPGDSGRGGNALHYSNLAIANLVSIAELNAAVGVNLYGDPADPKTIHRAINFLAKATQNPSLIAGYADTPDWQSGAFVGYSPTNQDRRWASNSNSIWGYYYLARYRGTEAGQNLVSASPFLRAGRSGTMQHAGGNPRCFIG